MKVPNPVNISDEELALGLCLNDQLLFSMLFQPGDISELPTVPQRLMFLDNSEWISICTSRSVLKTVSLIGRIMRRMATYLPREDGKVEEALVTAPAEAHLNPLVNRLFGYITNEPMLYALIKAKNGLTKGDKPEIKLKTNLEIYMRLEGSSGTDVNMVGIHPIWIISDEMAFGIEICHRSRLAGLQPWGQVIYAGVPNSVRSIFWKIDQTREGRDWSRHKFSMFDGNPLFIRSERHRERITKAFGGDNSVDFATQVKGEWGDEATASFPPGSISWNDQIPYFISVLSGEKVEEMYHTGQWQLGVGIPAVRAYRTCIGWDYGYSPDPSTFLIGVQHKMDDPWVTYARVSLFQVKPERQIEVLKYLVQTVLGNTVAMISVDNDYSYHELNSDRHRWLFGSRSKRAIPNGVVKIDMITGQLLTDEDLKRPDIRQHQQEGKVTLQNRRYWMTETLRRMMGNAIQNGAGRKLHLGVDPELENEFMVTVERREGGKITYHVPKRANIGGTRVLPDQIFDALRFLIDAISEVDRGEIGVNASELMEVLGWAGHADPNQPWIASYG